MIPVIFDKPVRGREIVEALANTAKGQGWQVRRFSETGLALGSVKKVEINRGLKMQIPLGERQTRFSRIQEELIVNVGDLGENDIRMANLTVHINQNSTSRLAPRDKKRRIAMACLYMGLTLASMCIPLLFLTLPESIWWTGLSLILFTIFFMMAMSLFVGGYYSQNVYLGDKNYARIEPKINTLLLETFRQLGQ